MADHRTPVVGNEFPPWTSSLLTAWQQELEDYQQWWSQASPADRDQSDWHIERCHIGFLSFAIRRAFPAAAVLQEFGHSKDSRDDKMEPRKIKGRADLWFGRQWPESCYIEAKQMDFKLSQRVDIDRAMGEARDDARRVVNEDPNAKVWAASFLSLWQDAHTWESGDRTRCDELWSEVEHDAKPRHAAAGWFALNPHPYEHTFKKKTSLIVSVGALLLVEKTSRRE
jgi:hypothetical protein